METQDMSWLDLSDGDAVSPDSLLDALLGDDQLGNVDMRGDGREQVEEPLKSPLKTSASGGEDTGVSTEKKKRRVRVNQRRPSQEIISLRRAAEDLEKLLELARQRHRDGRLLIIGEEGPRKGATTNVWMDVAARQYKYLRDAQYENERLRKMVLHQMRVAKSLTRLLQRALLDLPSRGIQCVLAEAIFNSSGFASKCEPLWAVVADMSESLSEDTVFEDESFIASKHELSNSRTYEFKADSIPPGARLASGSVRQFLHRPVEDVSAILWAFETPREDIFRIEQLDLGADTQVVQGTIQLSRGSVARCVIIRRLRVWDATRRTIIFASSLWPDPSNQSPWNRAGMDTKQWIDVRDSSISCDGEKLVEVRSRIEAYKLPDTPSVMPQPEARSLQEFVAKTVAFSMNHLQLKLDAILLRNVDVPNTIENE